MQQVGIIAAHIAEKCFSFIPKINFLKYFPTLSVRKRQKMRSIGNFLLLFVFPVTFVFFGYGYVEGKGGILKAVSDFGHLELKEVRLNVYHGDKTVHHTDWKVSTDAIKSALPVNVGTSMADINLDDIRKIINEVPWVKSSSVKMILPSTLLITLQERRPFALWQHDEMFYLIDETGARITNQNLERYDYLPWVVGEGANTRIYEYAALMNDYVDIFKHIKSAYRVGNRRWTLVTKNDVEISLSENNPRASLEQLIRLQAKRDILNDNITQIDLRIAGKTFIRQKGATTLSVYSGVNT